MGGGEEKSAKLANFANSILDEVNKAIGVDESATEMIGEIMEEIKELKDGGKTLDDVKRSMEDKVAQKEREASRRSISLCKEYYSYRGNSDPPVTCKILKDFGLLSLRRRRMLSRDSNVVLLESRERAKFWDLFGTGKPLGNLGNLKSIFEDLFKKVAKVSGSGGTSASKTGICGAEAGKGGGHW